ncbi:GRF-type domain-containing protein [Heracleum sosnowskyi]|uniref:GRF-type domain-containing protein n=1 Tax=Heracleum sosnowskyi TaxID=360622 RepID=A0AAD8MTQ3_9APIA|nr:GRF-type domain-containing protein [Heracleum sosnowskyi]
MNEYTFMSSSRSSSSSVRNPDGYHSNTNKQVRDTSSDFDYDFGGVKCKCDLPAPCQEAWKEGTLDPGKRFFGCSRYKMKDEELQSAKSEMNFVERKMLVLNEEVDALCTEMKEASTMLKKKEDGGCTLKKMVVYFVVVCVICALFK